MLYVDSLGGKKELVGIYEITAQKESEALTMNYGAKAYKEKAVQSIISGNKRIKVISTGPFWEYKEDYNGRSALIRCNGGVNIAISGMRPPQRECEEFYDALEIINEVERIKNVKTS